MAESRILGAKTLKAFVEAVNEHFQILLPVEFPEGSPLANLWATAVGVVKGTEKTAYTAKGLLTGFPFGFAQRVEGKSFKISVKMTVTEPSDESP